jgi:hypothetical protein
MKDNTLSTTAKQLLWTFIVGCGNAGLIFWLQPVGYWQIVATLQIIPWSVFAFMIVIVGLAFLASGK